MKSFRIRTFFRPSIILKTDKMKHKYFLPLVVFLLIIFGTSSLVHSDLIPVHNILRGDTVETGKIPTVKGGYIDISDYKGKKNIILVYWLHSCKLCTDQISKLNHYLSKNKLNNDFEVLTISRCKGIEKELIKRELKENNFSFDVMMDPELVLSRSFGINDVPKFIIIDKSSKVVSKPISLIDEPIRDMSLIDMINVIASGNNIPETQHFSYTDNVHSKNMIGGPAPDFILETINGNKITIEEYYKKMNLVIVFWHPYITTSQRNLQSLNSIYTLKNRKDYNFVILAISSIYGPSQLDKVRAFKEKYNILFPLLIDHQSEVGKYYGIKEIPTVIILDSNGIIIEAYTGEDMTIDKRLIAILSDINFNNQY